MSRSRPQGILPPGVTGTALVICCAAFFGCRPDGYGGVAIRGRVYLDGELLSAGSVVFVPTHGQHGPKCAAQVVDGQFAIAAETGPLPGRHKVQVYAAEEYAFAMDDPLDYAARAPAVSPANRVDAKFNEQSELEVVVSSTDENEFQFEVESASTQTAHQAP